jgi:hypothetical protein
MKKYAVTHDIQIHQRKLIYVQLLSPSHFITLVWIVRSLFFASMLPAPNMNTTVITKHKQTHVKKHTHEQPEKAFRSIYRQLRAEPLHQ